MFHNIIRVRPEDNKILSDLCFEIYPQTYSKWWHDEGKWYMEKVYNPEILLLELEDRSVEFYFLIINNEPRGYLKLNNSFKNEPFSFEIERIYIDTTFAGQGYGKLLLNFGIDIARSMESKTIFLKVMAAAEDRIKFYEKYGFQTIGSETLDYEKLKTELRAINTMKLLL